MNLSVDDESIRVLDDEEMVVFDQDFISDGRFASITTCIDRDFPDGRFSFLDVGGGNGQFADRLLDRYPLALGHLIDNSSLLIRRNAAHPRKTVHLLSVEELEKAFASTAFDLVIFNYSLHHFVLSSYGKTRAMQRSAIAAGVSRLAPHGRLSIVENLCDSYFGTFTGRFVHFLTSSAKLAPVIKKLGANTAGTGVCFLDRTSWRREIERAGLTVTHFEPEFYQHPVNNVKKKMLLMRDWRSGHYWAGRT